MFTAVRSESARPARWLALGLLLGALIGGASTAGAATGPAPTGPYVVDDLLVLTPGQTASATATCKSGDFVIGGYTRVGAAQVTAESSLAEVVHDPSTTATGEHNPTPGRQGWTATATAASSWNLPGQTPPTSYLDAFAVCLKTS